MILIPESRNVASLASTGVARARASSMRNSGCPGFSVAVLLLAAIMGAPANAQGFADDFSGNSLRYAVVNLNPGSSPGQATDVAGGIRLRIPSGDAVRPVLRMTVVGTTDTFGMRAVLGSDTRVPSTSGEGDVRIEGGFYNDSGDASDAGADVRAAVVLFVKGDGETGARVCAKRLFSAADKEPVGLMDGELCERIEGFVPGFEVEHALTLSLDRVARTLTASVDDRVRVINLPGPFHVPRLDEQYIQVGPPSVGGETVVDIRGVVTDDFEDDFAVSPPIIPGYRPLWELRKPGDRSLAIVDERARFAVATTVTGQRERMPLRVADDVDHLEGLVMLSSESDLPSDSLIGFQLQGRFYTDVPIAGDDPRIGDVYANVQITVEGNGRRRARYCLGRERSTDGSILNEPLMDPTNQCLDFGIEPALDTVYPASVSLDRDGSAMHFTFGEEVRTHPIDAPILDARAPFHEAVVYAEGQGRAVGYLDDFRTAPDALTPGESGITSSPTDSPDDDGGSQVDDSSAEPDPGSGSAISTASGSVADTLLDDGVRVVDHDDSGSGCSIAPRQGRRDPLLPVSLLIAGWMLLGRGRGAAVRSAIRQQGGGPPASLAV